MHSIPRALGLTTALLALAGSPSDAEPSGSVTTWIGGFGDWTDAGNWSDGVPTAGVTARLTAVGIAQVTQAGAACRRLEMAIGGEPTLRIQGGTLAVTDTLQVGIDDLGTVQQFSGTVTAGTLVIGGEQDGGGAYLMTSGSLAVQSASIPTLNNFSSGSLSLAQASTFTVAGSFHVGTAGSFTIGGTATFTVGTAPSDALTLDGSFSITGTPNVNLTRFTMSPDAVLSATLTLGQHAPILVGGPAIIDGTLLLLDVQTPDGSYELVRGNPLSGGFDSAVMSPGWSWRIAGNSLWADKSSTPVETAHWGGVKERFAR